MSDDDRALEEEARALLRPIRTPPPVPADVRARALRRMALAIPVPGHGGEGPGDPGATGEPGAPPSPGPSGSAAPAVRSGLAQALATRVPAWSLLVSFVAGGALVAVAARPGPVAPSGAAASVVVTARAASSAEPASTPSVVARPAEASTSVAVAEAAPVASASPAPAPPAAPSTRPSGARPGGEGTLEAERALLDVARTALGRGDGAHALQAADEHARRFPRGALAEEREAMSIQALRLLGRDGDAHARLDRFRGRFPQSLIRPALEAEDGGSP